MRIGKHKIGLNQKPFIIAEMSGNHNHSLERALQLVEAAAEAGVQALKIQTYTADTITLNVRQGEFVIQDKKSLWYGRTLYDLYEDAHTPWEWHEPIIKHAEKLGLVCFSSPFDFSAVDFLEGLHVPAYKIASPEITHLPLIAKAAATGKPLIFSTGMASISEIGEAVETAKLNGATDLVLLKCTSSYPANPDNINILTISHLREAFKCEVGLSDHTLGIGAAVAAVAHGASVIEKHLTLSRSEGGVDSAFSMEPAELRQLVTEVECAHKALGSIVYGPVESEKPSLPFRQSIYITKDIKRGTMLSAENIRIVRPGMGIEPKYWDIVLGRTIKEDVKIGTALQWDMIL